MSKAIKVSVLCMAYNQEQFIRKTLDGFVMQKTNFPFEVIVHDDASTDSTPDIIREYAEKYPDIIVPVLSTENHFQAHRNILMEEFLPRTHGKYVAHCDGDDWWTDENKLQTQADFLDNHDDFSICCTCAKVVWADGSKKTYITPAPHSAKKKSERTFEDLLHSNFIVNSSVMYRWNFAPNDWETEPFIPGDWLLHLLHARYGKIKIFAKPMVVYSRWNGGIWQDGNNPDFFIKNAFPLIQFFKTVEKTFNVDKSEEIGKMVTSIIDAYIQRDLTDKIPALFEKFPDIQISLNRYTKKIETENAVNIRKLKHRKQSWYYITPALLLIMGILALL